jgi:hypothetical protein
VAQFLQLLDIALLAFAVTDAGDDLQHALGPHPARRALAAALVLDEVEEVAGHVDHAAVVVHDDAASRAHDGAQVLQSLVVDGDIEIGLGDAAPGGAAELHGLELLAVGHTPADLVHDLAQLHSDRHLHQPGVLDGATQGEHLGALALLRAGAGVPLRPLEDDGGDVGESLDVVEHAGFVPQALNGRERRTGAGLSSSPFDTAHQRGLLAADEGPRTHADLEVELKAGAHDVLTEQAQFPGLVDGVLQPLDRQGILGPQVHEPLFGPDGISPDGHALDEAVGVALQHGAIHEGSRIALVRVAQDVLDVGRGLAGELPLESRGEAGAAAPAQPAAQDLAHHLVRSHLGEHLGQRLIALAGDVLLDLERVDDSRVAEDDLDLPIEELDVAHLGHGAVRTGGMTHQPVDHPAFEQVFLDDLMDVL